jgi:hypothetical protein
LEEELDEQIQLHEWGSSTTDRAIELATRLLKRKFKGRLSETDLNTDIERIRSLIRLAQLPPAGPITDPDLLSLLNQIDELRRESSCNNSIGSMDANSPVTSTGRKEGTDTDKITGGPDGSTTTRTTGVVHLVEKRELGGSEPSRVTEPVTTNRSIDARPTVTCTAGKNAGESGGTTTQLTPGGPTTVGRPAGGSAEVLGEAGFKKPAPPAAGVLITPRKRSTPYNREGEFLTLTPRGRNIILQRRVSRTTNSEGKGTKRLIAGTSIAGANQQEDADDYMLPDIHDSSDTE